MINREAVEIADRMRYYSDNYDCVFTYVHNVGETQAIVDYTDKVCRFCGKRYPDVKFKKKAHAVSELLGNKEFVLKNECDECNIFFGQKLEDNLAKYIGLGRTLSQVFGKEGVPSYKSKDESWRVDFTNKGLVIQMKENSNGVEEKDNYILFHPVRDAYTPIAVYKALVKMALSLLPYEKMPYFLDTVDWIKEGSHIISKYDMSNYAYMIERFVPGPHTLCLRASGFIRKSFEKKVPYYIFLLEFQNYSYQIIVPCRVKDGVLEELEEVDFVQIPGSDETLLENSFYGKPISKLVDLHETSKIKGETFDLCLSLEHKELNETRVNENVTEAFKKEGIILDKRLK